MGHSRAPCTQSFAHQDSGGGTQLGPSTVLRWQRLGAAADVFPGRFLSEPLGIKQLLHCWENSPTTPSGEAKFHHLVERAQHTKRSLLCHRRTRIGSLPPNPAMMAEQHPMPAAGGGDFQLPRRVNTPRRAKRPCNALRPQCSWPRKQLWVCPHGRGSQSRESCRHGPECEESRDGKSRRAES